MGNLSLLQGSLPARGEHTDFMLTASMCCLQLRRILDDILDFDKISEVRCCCVSTPRSTSPACMCVRHSLPRYQAHSPRRRPPPLGPQPTAGQAGGRAAPVHGPGAPRNNRLAGGGRYAGEGPRV